MLKRGWMVCGLVLGLAACGGDDASSDVAQGGTGQGGGAQGGSSGSSQGAQGGGAGSSQGGGAGGGGGGEWTQLLSGDWSLDSGDEAYECVLFTVPEDMYVSGFRPIAPTGTHHTVLTREEATSRPDGVSPCNAATNGPNMIYGSGVGTEPLEFPQGVAIKLVKGERLMLNLHLFNVSPKKLTGSSGIEVLRVAEADVVHEAEMVLAGKDQGLTVETGESTQTGHCTMSGDTTVFAVLPHMHQLGIHMKVSAELPGGDQTLLDTDYSFDEQKYVVQDPNVSLSQGTRLRIECTYYNDRGEMVYFGDSSLAEMCYAGTYRYPKLGTAFITCTQ